MLKSNNKFCLECGKPRRRVEKYCRHCGSQYPVDGNVWLKNLMIGIGLVVLFVIIVAMFSSEGERTQNSQSVNSGLPNNVVATVVNVYCPYIGQPMSFESEGYGGSGTVIDKEGIVLTNSHVIPQDEEYMNINDEGCFVIFPNTKTGSPEEIYLAEPIVLNNISDKYDLAFLNIYDVFVDLDGTKYGTYPREFTALTDEACDDKELELGEKVVVYGYPASTGGVSLTVTEGLVSTLSPDGIFTSAKIDQGNSGGLATDSKGCFIGVPSAVSSGEFESYGIIVPANIVSDFMTEVSDLVNHREDSI